MSSELVANQQRRKNERRIIYIVGNRNQAMTSEGYKRRRQHVL
jgi:hypothetical protein